MQITIFWQYNPKIDKWVVQVVRNRYYIALLLRQDEASCRAWAEKNIHVYRQGKEPQFV